MTIDANYLAKNYIKKELADMLVGARAEKGKLERLNVELVGENEEHTKQIIDLENQIKRERGKVSYLEGFRDRVRDTERVKTMPGQATIEGEHRGRKIKAVINLPSNATADDVARLYGEHIDRDFGPGRPRQRY